MCHTFRTSYNQMLIKTAQEQTERLFLSFWSRDFVKARWFYVCITWFYRKTYGLRTSFCTVLDGFKVSCRRTFDQTICIYIVGYEMSILKPYLRTILTESGLHQTVSVFTKLKPILRFRLSQVTKSRVTIVKT